MRNSTKITVEGFEDYSVQFISDRVFYNRNMEQTWYYNMGGYTGKHSIVLYDESFFIYNGSQLSMEFPETGNLANASKVYVHPNCSLSKQLVYAKYNRVLDPWNADVVVIPKPQFDGFYYNQALLAINEKYKTIILCDVCSFLNNPVTAESVKNAEYLGDVIRNSYIENRYSNTNSSTYVQGYYRACNAKIDGIYKLIAYRPDNTWLKELRDGKLPKDRIVYESSVMSALGSDENKIDFDVLVNIYDMLISKDEAVQSTGVKALAMLDWANYPVSVSYVLQKSFDINSLLRYNRMWTTTAAKFMKKSLGNMPSRYIPFSAAKYYTITQDDWNILQKLMQKNGDYLPRIVASFQFLEFKEDGTIRIIEP